VSGKIDTRLFLKAQDTVWDSVIAELTKGRKTSHWMWFVFPQLTSLGRSQTAQIYGISDLAEAQAYLDDPTLRQRLVQVCGLMLLHSDKSPEEILGSIDAMKLRSSMTLFAAIPDAPDVFSEVLDAFYDGQHCDLTQQALKP
jgi:uncharacterized protein (DUF1810 family)